MTLIESMLQALANPAQKHAILIHLPIAISLLAVPATIASACIKSESNVLRWCCIILLAIGTVTGWMAEEAGEAAINELDTSTLSENALATLETHEELGEKVWILYAATTIACGLTFMKVKWVKVSASILTIVLSIILMGYVAVTSHHGGTLVYQHGAGIPTQTE